MKHPISILQSRIAKRSKLISDSMLPLYESPRLLGYSRHTKIRDGLSPNHPKIVYLSQQQKEDKKILAEIIWLRRQIKVYDGVLYGLYKAECAEMDNKILEARWGA